MQIPRAVCKKRLTVLWFSGAGFLFILLLLQTLLGRYGEGPEEAWAWFLPTVMPTLSLMIGILVSEALAKDSEKALVDRFVYKLAFVVSLVYLTVVSLTIFLSPFSSLGQLELMTMSNLWLAPFQGLATAALGAFFVNRQKD